MIRTLQEEVKKKKKGGKKRVQMDVTHKELPGLQSWT